MRLSRASNATVSSELSGSRTTKPARPLTVAGRVLLATSATFLRAIAAKKRMILSAPRIGGLAHADLTHVHAVISQTAQKASRVAGTSLI